MVDEIMRIYDTITSRILLPKGYDMTITDDELMSEDQDLWALIERIEAKAKRKLSKYSGPSVFSMIEIRVRRFKKLPAVDRTFVRQRLHGRRVSGTFTIQVDDEKGTIRIVAD